MTRPMKPRIRSRNTISSPCQWLMTPVISSASSLLTMLWKSCYLRTGDSGCRECSVEVVFNPRRNLRARFDQRLVFDDRGTSKWQNPEKRYGPSDDGYCSVARDACVAQLRAARVC